MYTAQTSKEASEKLSTKKFDVALIDVGLGETLGTDLLPQMNKVAPGMLKIVFTGTPMSKGTLDEANSRNRPISLKPVKPQTLIGILNEKLEQKISIRLIIINFLIVGFSLRQHYFIFSLNDKGYQEEC